MLRLRMVLLTLALSYLTNSIVGVAQSLDTRITIVEQKLNNYIDRVNPELDRVNELNGRIYALEYSTNSRLITLEQAYKQNERAITNLMQLVIAIASGIGVQLLISLLRVMQNVRKRQGPPETG